MLPISIWTGYFGNLSLWEIVSRLRKAGFRYGELDCIRAQALLQEGEPAAVGAKLRAYIQDLDYQLLQGHLQFQKGFSTDAVVDELKRELELYEAIGIRNAVLHVVPSKEESYGRCVENLRTLREFVKGTELYLCLENMSKKQEVCQVESLLQLRADAGEENIGICLDTGHLHLSNGLGLTTQSQREFILKAGSHLRALHIHENNGKNDVHLLPYSAQHGIDWTQVTGALREIGYQGLFNLELSGEYNTPEPIREAKLRYLRELTELMLAE